MPNVDLTFADEAVQRIGKTPDTVIPILQAIQEHYGYLPEEVLRRVCASTQITPAAVMGVSSFYDMFRHQPVGKHIVRVCRGTACHVIGAERVEEALRRRLRIPAGEDTDPDRQFTIEPVACLGCCTLAPVVRIQESTFGYVSAEKVPGIIREFLFPDNSFFAAENEDLILFSGKEPNLNWVDYADCIFALCQRLHVKSIYFIGSVAGLVPHTRDPTHFCSVSDALMKPRFESYGMKFSDYEGPASIITYLTTRAKEQDVEMVGIVATVPAYVQGANPKCIVAATRRIAGILGIRVDLDDLQASADEFEKKLSEIVQEQPELAENVVKLEQDYDNEIFSEMGDLKHWLHQKGIRLD